MPERAELKPKITESGDPRVAFDHRGVDLCLTELPELARNAFAALCRLPGREGAMHQFQS